MKENMTNNWFSVDKNGLYKLLEQKGKAFAIFELIQNAWDEDVTNVSVSLTPIPNKHCCKLIVVDNSPEGFKNLTHAFTLFAESDKKKDPTKRGRFNLGEKLVLACCEEAEISTTTGTVFFSNNGTRQVSKKSRTEGSKFEAIIKMTRTELDETLNQINTLIPPDNIITTINDEKLIQRIPIREFQASLPTEISDDEGMIKKTKRQTIVKLYKPLKTEIPHIYEMGIPVVESDNKFHINIQQKVPLNFDRNNVTPAYLRELRTIVLNEAYSLLESEEDFAAPWVNNALEDERVNPEAVQTVINNRFGKDAVSYDPSDPEGSKISTSQGRAVIFGGTFNKKQWNNIKKSHVLVPAGQVTPSPKPYSNNGKPLEIIFEDEWTPEIKNVVEYSKFLAKELMDVNLSVKVAYHKNWGVLATYGNKELTFNLADLGRSFFNNFTKNQLDVDRLLIHEFGHEYSSDHLSSKYYDALCLLGAKLAELSLNKPELLKAYRNCRAEKAAASGTILS